MSFNGESSYIPTGVEGPVDGEPDEIDLNSGDDEPVQPKLEIRTQPEDIFEDILEDAPEAQESVAENTPSASFEPTVTSPRPQVILIKQYYIDMTITIE